ncbi:MAG: replication initiator protein [Arizlama microvirus]|nr:MAG: replication initiator protein [Arizlama microvirus]
MPCANPIRAYRAATGGPLLFNAPNTWKGATTYTALDIPCGHCILCRNEQARQTAVRIYHESQSWIENSFITLTYDDANIPTNGSLDYSHLQKFWKRLRKQIGELRYYAVGEYGDKTLRPHYHACLFGHAFIEDRIIIKEQPHRLWSSPMLNQVWGLGNVTVGALNFQTARYTASYVTKKLRTKQRYVRIDEQTGELVPVTQPRAFMSRNIGKDWWITYGHQLKDHDRVIINGQKQKPPRAYDKWLGEINESKLKEIKAERKAKAIQLTPDQNRARARSAHAHAERKTKTV